MRAGGLAGSDGRLIAPVPAIMASQPHPWLQPRIDVVAPGSRTIGAASHAGTDE